MDEEMDHSQQGSSLSRNLKRKTRYREMLTKVEDLEESGNVGQQVVNTVRNILHQATELEFEVPIEDRVANSDETILDFKVLALTSMILNHCTGTLDASASTYKADEFAERIKQSIQETEGILCLISDARKIIPEVPKFNGVYGTYDLNTLPVPKEKKERIKANSQVVVKQAPEKVVNTEKEEEGIEEIVSSLHKILVDAYKKNRERPVNFYTYVIDTDSYTDTIENIFYFAFLIRDGRAQIDLDGKGKPIITPASKTALQEFRGRNAKNSQLMPVITMDMWEKFTSPGLLQQRKSLA